MPLTRTHRTLRALRWALVPWLALAQPVQAERHTFQLEAPAARQVFLAGEMTDWDRHKRPMIKGNDGAWRLEVDLGPGQWLYKFVVDGRWIADPGTAERDADGHGGEHSFVFIGAGDWQVLPDVAKGRVDTVRLPSAALGQPQKVNVYLPPGFVRGQSLPVLWLLHGWGVDADQWAKTGKVERYMNNLIARRAVRPFVIVMPSVPGSRTAPPYGRAGERYLTQELPAWLEETYGLRTERARSAIAGGSWGALGAFHLASLHPRLYGLAVPLSGYFSDDYIATLPTSGALPMQLLLLCGRDDDLVATNRKLVASLQARQARFTYREDPGAHTWQYWSQRMVEMLSVADAYFRDNGSGSKP